MNWLRIDSGLSRHPKILMLTPAQRWTWIDALCWAAEFSEYTGELPNAADRAVAGLKKLRPRLRELGLLDVGDVVHDWILYTGASTEEKVRWFLEQNPDASANEVVRQLRAQRSLVLKLVDRYRSEKPGSEPGSHGTTSEPRGGGSDGTTLVVPANAHARSAQARNGTLRNEEEPSSVVESVERLATDDDDINFADQPPQPTLKDL